jgi:hypothetical protein
MRSRSEPSRVSAYPSGASISCGGIAPEHASQAAQRQNMDLPEPGAPET